MGDAFGVNLPIYGEVTIMENTREGWVGFEPTTIRLTA
jgi:hypothetical protein